MKTTVISVSIQLVLIMKMNVPTSVTVPEMSEVSELFIITSILSISFVKRDIISPVGWLSKYLTGSLCSFSNRSFLIFSTMPCDTESIRRLCTYVVATPIR